MSLNNKYGIARKEIILIAQIIIIIIAVYLVLKGISIIK